MPRDPFKPVNTRSGPERIIQDEWLKYLRAREWFVLETHGNMYQQGFPDLYITHLKYRQRWVEIKNLDGSFSFTQAQLDTFPRLSAHGSPIWVLGSCCDSEYAKLWRPENWHHYLPYVGIKKIH